jgi:hypothetical protein
MEKMKMEDRNKDGRLKIEDVNLKMEAFLNRESIQKILRIVNLRNSKFGVLPINRENTEHQNTEHRTPNDE